MATEGQHVALRVNDAASLLEETAIRAGVPPPPPNWDADTAASTAYFACGVAYSEYKMNDDPTTDWNHIGTGEANGKILAHDTGGGELVVGTNVAEGRVTVLFRGTKTPLDAYRDATFLSVDPTAYLGLNGGEQVSFDKSVSLTSAVFSCFDPLRAFKPRMHRGFATRSSIHVVQLMALLLEEFDGDLSKIKKLTFTGHSLGGAASMGLAYILRRFQEELKDGGIKIAIEPTAP